MASLDLILRIVSTLATVAIGVAAAFLAYRQYKISHTKLKFDLYERRLALLTTLMDLADQMGHVEQSSDASKILGRINQLFEHQFLLDDPVITAHVSDMSHYALKMTTAMTILERKMVPPDKVKDEELTVMESRGWFLVLRDNIPDLFKKHLSLKTLT